MKNIVGRDAGIRSHSRRVCALLCSTALIMVLSGVNGRAVRANSQAQRPAVPASSEPLVIQGRITAIQEAIVTVKTPYGYPGARGGHPQYVTAGPTFRVDVAHAHILLPDGRREDRIARSRNRGSSNLLMTPFSIRIDLGCTRRRGAYSLPVCSHPPII